MVSPELYADWSALTKEESKNIAVTLTMTNGWKQIMNGVWATGTSGILSGTISPKTSATIISEVKHGNSFDEIASSTFKIDWFIKLE